jgi:CheY-like chemotaxis protein
MDLQMPIMDGFECTIKIRELERQYGTAPAYITGLSGHSDNMMKDKCFEVGMNSFSKRLNK